MIQKLLFHLPYGGHLVDAPRRAGGESRNPPTQLTPTNPDYEVLARRTETTQSALRFSRSTPDQLTNCSRNTFFR